MYSSLNVSRTRRINITDAQIVFLYQPLILESNFVTLKIGIYLILLCNTLNMSDMLTLKKAFSWGIFSFLYGNRDNYHKSVYKNCLW